MRPYLHALIASGFFMLFFYADAGSAPSPFSIVPAPQSCRINSGAFTFRPGMGICIKGGIKNVNQAAGMELAAAISNAFKYQYKVQPETSPAQSLDINLFQDDRLYNDSVLRDAALKEEAYTITVTPSRINVRAVSQKGIMHAVMSLTQLISQSKDQTISCFELVDYPDLKMRGISDDISRGQVSTQEKSRGNPAGVLSESEAR